MGLVFSAVYIKCVDPQWELVQELFPVDFMPLQQCLDKGPQSGI